MGSHIADAHVTRGDEVAVVDNLTTGASAFLNTKAEFFDGDITDREAMERVFEAFRPEVVNHLAADVGVRGSMENPVPNARTNVLGTVQLLQLSVTHDVKQFVFASTGAVYSEPEYVPMDESHSKHPQSAYGVSKLAGEQYVRMFSDAYGIGYKAFRYGNFYGPRQNPHGEAGVVAIFAGQMLRGQQPIIFGDGNKTRDYIYVDDVAQANLLAADGAGDNGIYNISRSVEVTDLEIFDAVRRAVGASVEPQYVTKRPGEPDRIILDSARARAELGWNAEIDLDVGIGRTVRALREISE